MSITGSGSDSVVGNSDNEVLTGAPSGASTMVDSGANDTFIVTNTADSLTDSGSEGAVVSTVTWTLGTNFTDLTLSGAGALTGTGNGVADVLTSSATGTDTLINNSGANGGDTFVVNHAGDSVVENGSSANNAVVSNINWTLGAKFDQLTLTAAGLTGTGNTLADVLTSSNAGKDTLIGDDVKSGTSDTFYVNFAGDGVTENGTGLADTVVSNSSFTLGAKLENLTLTGASALSGTGNSLANAITGNTGSDTLSDGGVGGAGDTLVGNSTAGTDTFIVSNATDHVSESVTSGAALIQSSASWSLANAHSIGVNELTLTGSAALTGTGNTLGDILTSSTTGTDKLIGAGTAGNDTFYVNHSGDTVTENGTSTENVVVSNISFTLGAHLQDLTLTGVGALSGTGNTLANVIVGNANTTGHDVLSDGGVGGGGDTITGNSTLGTDTFIVNNTDDQIAETHASGGAGDVSLVQSSVSFALGANMEALTLTGTGFGLTATGNSNANVITDATTTTGIHAGSNTLIGDSTNGGDTFVVSHTGDAVTENGGTTTANTVISSVSFALGANLNNLILTGATAITATGNSLADVLTSSLTGTDKLIGASTTGNDTFYVNHAGDTVTESGTGIANVVYSNATFTLGANLQELILTGSASITGTGNADADTLISSSTGIDKLVGLGGADTFYLNHTGDTASENNVAGGAVVYSGITFALGAHMQDLHLTGATNLAGTGNSLANTISGSTGSDTLSDGSAAAADTLIGNSTNGTDTFIVNNSGDSLTETNANGVGDVALVQSAVSWTLGTNMNALTLTGSGHGLVATGNATSNILADATTGTAATGLNTLIGDSTNDTFVVNHSNDIVSEAGVGTGDLVQSSVSFSLANVVGSAINNLTLTGATAAVATGNTTGGILISNTGKDTLIGHASSGADTFIINNAGDTISEAGSTITSDVVESSVSYTLAAGFQNLTLTGSAALVGTGNTLADILTSSSTGIDKLVGQSKTGGDTFIVNHTGDTVSEVSTVTTGDLIESSVNFSMASSALGHATAITGLTMLGTSNVTATGSIAGGDTITGNTGADVLSDGGTTAADTLIGNSSTGHDTFIVSNTHDAVSEGGAAGNLVQSSVSFSLGNVTGAGAVNNLTLTGAASLTGTGNTNGDILTSSTTGTDALIGNRASGADTFIINHAGDTVTENGATIAHNPDLVESTISYSLASVHGTAVNELTLIGTGHALVATGNTNADLITDATTGTGATGANTLIGNSTAGGDSFIVTHTGDVVTENGGTTTANTVESSVNFTLGAKLQDLILNNTGTVAVTGTGNTLADVLTSSSTGKDVLIGASTTGNDTFYVNFAGDTVTEGGNGTANLVVSDVTFALGAHLQQLTLTGASAITGTGNTLADILTSSTTGVDTLIGNSTTGNDTFYVNFAGDAVTENGTGTANSVISTVDFAMGAHLQNLTLTGSGAINGTGNTLANVIVGNANSSGTGDVLSDGGAGGADTITGNSTTGNDTFIVSNTGDHVTEIAATHGALIEANSTFSLMGTGVNQLTLIGSGTGLTATGNAANDTLVDNGTVGGNTLTDGNNGGHDAMSSTAANDTFIMNNVGDTATESAVSTTAAIEANFNYTLGTNFNILTLTGSTATIATGNAAGGDTITGNTANDAISDNGAAIADSLIGNSTGAGDTFIVTNAGDSVSEAGSATGSIVMLQGGSNALNFSLAGTNVNRLTMTGTGNDSGTGNGSADTIIGNTGDDLLSDGTGAGADSLQGHSSNGGDTFVVNNSNDVINEAGNIGGGHGAIETSLAGTAFNSLTGAYANFYNLTLLGTANASATGNNLDNTLTGNTGDDTLISGTGHATMIGYSNDTSASGGDTFDVNNASDSVTEINIEAAALVSSSVSFSLVGTNVNALTLTAGNLTATGNSGADTLTGNSGGDVLVSGSGIDSLVAGTGLETFIINNSGDVISEGHAATGSIVEAYASFTLGTNLNSLTMMGSSALTGTGNSTGGDTITGNTGNDVLSDGGSSAADTLIGNSSTGADTFVISNTLDMISETNGPGAGAMIQSAVNYALGTGYDQLTLTAAGITGTGNSDAGDTIIGASAGADTLISDITGTGTDSLVGNAGADVFDIRSATETNLNVLENNVAGGAIVNSTVSFTLGANMTTLNLDLDANANNVTGTGNAAGGDTITGNTGNDVFSDGGNDTGAGDKFVGHSAAGHDTFIVHNTDDSITESGTAGANLVETYSSYSLNAVSGIGRLALEGTTGGLTATGNATGNDTLTDSTGAGAGGDVLDDGGYQSGKVDVLTDSSTVGGDTFIVTNSGDVVTEGAGHGTIIFNIGSVGGSDGTGTVNYTMGTNITTVTLEGSGADTITGNGSAGTITANTGDDMIIAGTGADTMYAGVGGNDTFVVNSDNDSVVGNNLGGNDLIEYKVTGNSTTYTLGLGLNNMLLFGTGAGNDSVAANTGNDVITAQTTSNTFYDGGTDDTHVLITSGGADTFKGGGGFDVFNIHNANDYISEAHTGQYLVNSYVSFDLGNQTNVNNLTLMGNADLSGTASHTVEGAVIVGNKGNDILSDGGDATNGVGDILIGNDTVVGGIGDTFVVSNTVDTVSEAGTNHNATIDASVNFTLGANMKTLILTGNAALTGTGNATASNADIIVGNAGNDTLSDGGNDTSASVIGLNADTMIGHDTNAGGADTFFVYNTGDVVTELGPVTGSVIEAYVTTSLVNTNVNIANLKGNGAGITVTGNSGNDTITDSTTGTGGDVLISGSGVSILDDESTAGGDTFYVNNTGDTVTEHAGVAVVHSTVSFSLGSVAGAGTATSLVLSGSNNITATAANTGNDTINAAATTGGTDILSEGTGGNDSLIGSTAAGVHTTFIVNHATDTISASANGVNTIVTSLNTTFNDLGAGADAHVTNLVLTAASRTGTASGTASNSITGQGGSDTLSDAAADAFADTLIGTGGGDVFNVNNAGDHVTESGASATVNSSVSFALGANMHTLNLTAAAASSGLTLTGTSGADTITDNSTHGGDIIRDGGGADHLTDASTSGNDTFYVTNTGDVLVETNGTAATVNSTVSFALGAHMTSLVLSGDINLSGTANTTGNDTITGNQGDDVLKDSTATGAGNTDTLIGNSIDGGDTFVVYNSGDVISEAFGNGTATVDLHLTSGTFAMGTHIDNLILVAGGGDTLAGNGSGENITITDNGTGGDVLNGNGTGMDTLIDNSSGGSDTFDVNNINDVVTETNGTGTINFGVSGNVTYTLGANMGTLDAHTASGNDTLTANAGADTITGSTGSDSIVDGGGADSLIGEAAAGHSDTFSVSNVNDNVHEAGAGTGVILSSVSWSLATNTNNVSTLDITGTGHTATGITTGSVTLEDLSGGNTLTVGSGSTHADTLIGGNDIMNLSTSTGADHVVFSAATAYNGIATINNFVHSQDVLNIDNIISGANGGNNVSYKLVADTDGTDTDLLVDYNHASPSYGFVEVAKIIGLTITSADIT